MATSIELPLLYSLGCKIEKVMLCFGDMEGRTWESTQKFVILSNAVILVGK